MIQRFTLIAVALFVAACQPNKVIEEVDHSGLIPIDIKSASADEFLSGGAATTFVSSNDAFSQRPPAIAKNFMLDAVFKSGDHLFRSQMNGVGPLLNTGNCQGCHLNDGRGVVPKSVDEPFTSMLVKLGDISGRADPVYGDQIKPFTFERFVTSNTAAGTPSFGAGLSGDLVGEAFPFIEFEELTGSYADGETYSLRQPIYKFKDLAYGDFTDNARFSVRVAPQVFGAGLLGAIPEKHIIALADPDDIDGDEISGRVSWVSDVATDQKRVGRFAYKAQTSSVLQQVAAAFNGDSGVTSSLFPDESCTPSQTACLTAANDEANVGPTPDVDDTVLAFIEFYNRTLAVPARRGFDKTSKQWDPQVANGRTHFMQIGCDSCHTPRHQTGLAKGSVLGMVGLTGLTDDAPPVDVLSNQTIYPYTDLLVHDMGGQCTVAREDLNQKQSESGEQCLYVQRCTGLADGLPQGDVTGTEWKTPALWGLGLVQTVNPQATFLHDGRARTIEEAVLWHDGEAQQSQQAFVNLIKTERKDLLAFLQSL